MKHIPFVGTWESFCWSAQPDESSPQLLFLFIQDFLIYAQVFQMI
jgi:hypothetical protein